MAQDDVNTSVDAVFLQAHQEGLKLALALELVVHDIQAFHEFHEFFKARRSRRRSEIEWIVQRKHGFWNGWNFFCGDSERLRHAWSFEGQRLLY